MGDWYYCLKCEKGHTTFNRNYSAHLPYRGIPCETCSKKVSVNKVYSYDHPIYGKRYYCEDCFEMNYGLKGHSERKG